MRILTTLAACCLASPAWAGVDGDPSVTHTHSIRCVAADLVPPPAPERIEVDLVVCLDTSGSMTGLIDSARARLWDIVNEFGKAKPIPKLRVALLTYGSPNLAGAAQGFVVKQIDLTDDLDSVYEKMMGMTTSGGDEYVGWVLNDAVRTLSWSSDPKALRMIYVAGNESADQAAGQFNFRQVAQLATGKDIIINSIYAGNKAQGIQEMWHAVAQYGGGTYAAISMDEGTYQITAPQDAMLQKLNVELNVTYIPYGDAGAAGLRNQSDQDGNAMRMGGQSGNSRVAAKATSMYSNSFWDLVDAADGDDFRLESLKEEELPKKMRSMKPEEREAYIEGMRAARGAVQEKIVKLSKDRDAFLKAERARRKTGNETGLDDALLKSIREHAEKKGFKFSDK